MGQLMAIILAAGEGGRMKSKKPKVLHKICGKAVMEWVYDAAANSGIINESIAVVGHAADQVKECLGDRVKYVFQDVRLGTGHAVTKVREYLKGGDGDVMVLYGDMPLITVQTVSTMVACHRKNDFSATIISTELDEPAGHGAAETDPGVCCFKIRDLLDILEIFDGDEQTKYTMADIIGNFLDKGLKVGTFKPDDPDEILDVNDRIQLLRASGILRNRILSGHMKSGVTIMDPGSTYIDDMVEIGMDTVVYPGTILEGGTKIGEDCMIGPYSRIVNSVVGNSTEVVNSVVMDSSIGSEAHIGPFAYIRPESRIGNKVKIGDFVEIKKSVVGDRTKIPHLAYIGDAEVGVNTNIACGVITVNYDGRKKNKTVIGNDAFVGCNVNLIAPVVVNSNSYIAAGSTITDEVPEYSLAIARERQVIKDDWVNRKGMRRNSKGVGK